MYDDAGVLSAGFVCLVLIVLGLIVLSRATYSVSKRFFAVMCGSLGLWVVANSLADYSQSTSLFWTRLTFFAVSIALLSFVLFVVDFPTRGRLSKKARALFIIVGILVAISSWMPSFIKGITFKSNFSTPLTGLLYDVFVGYFLIYFGYAIAILIRKMRTEQRVNRERIKFILLGVALLGVVSSITNLFLPLLLHSNTLIDYGTFATILFAAPITYAIVRHRLFDIRLLATRFLVYAALVVVMSLVYGLVVTSVALYGTHSKLTVTQSVIITLTTIGLVAIFQPLKRVFDHATRVIFYQDAYDTQIVLDKVNSSLVRATAVSQLAGQTLHHLAEVLNAEYGAIILTGKRGDNRIFSVGSVPRMLIGDVEEIIKSSTKPLLVLDEIEELSPGIQEKMQRANVNIITHLRTSKEKLGYMVFGYKISGNMYNEQDVGLVHTATDEVAVAIQNALRFEEIEQFTKTLEVRVEEATAELRQTNKKLRELDEAKDEFMSLASHQLRTPLTTVKGYLSMALEGDAGKLNTEQMHLLRQAYISSQRMVFLIADFLNVSRIKTGKFLLEPKDTDLRAIIAGEIDQLTATAANRKVALIYEEPPHFPTLYLDDEKIRQVIMNFIDNAIYYTPASGTITVKLYTERDQAIFKVIDTGIGVPAGERSHLFTKFYRASNARQARPDGTGIGLFMAKKIIDMESGTLIFESEVGKGSTFGFSLPMKKVAVK